MSAVLSKNKTRSTQKMCQVSKTYLKLAVDGRALVHGDLGLDERGHVVNIRDAGVVLALIHMSEPTRQAERSYAVFWLKKKMVGAGGGGGGGGEVGDGAGVDVAGVSGG